MRKKVTILDNGEKDTGYLVIKARKHDRNFSKLYNAGAKRLACEGLPLWELRLFLYFVSLADASGCVPVCPQRCLAQDLGTSQNIISVALSGLVDREFIYVVQLDGGYRNFWQINPGIVKKW
jgi:hypothetical protein